MEFQWYKLYREKVGNQALKEYRSGFWEENYLDALEASKLHAINKKVDVVRELIIARKNINATCFAKSGEKIELEYTWKIILYFNSDIEIISYDKAFNDYDACLQDADQCSCENRYSFRKIICARVSRL